jgi:hypothetical protein
LDLLTSFLLLRVHSLIIKFAVCLKVDSMHVDLFIVLRKRFVDLITLPGRQVNLRSPFVLDEHDGRPTRVRHRAGILVVLSRYLATVLVTSTRAQVTSSAAVRLGKSS